MTDVSLQLGWFPSMDGFQIYQAPRLRYKLGARRDMRKVYGYRAVFIRLVVLRCGGRREETDSVRFQFLIGQGQWALKK